MCLYIAGDVEPEKVVKSIKDIFGSAPSSPHTLLDGIALPVGPEPCLWPQKSMRIEHDFSAKRDKRLHTTSHDLVCVSLSVFVRLHLLLQIVTVSTADSGQQE